MKFVRDLPFASVLGEDSLDCVLWESAENACELENEDGLCDPSGYYYGTSDSREPKFCARHFYLRIVNGDGEANYRLEDRVRASEI